MSRSRRFVVSAAAIALGAATLTGCSSTVSMTAASAANDPACAEVMARLPDAVDGQARRWTDAQATGAWGEPVTVLMTCGLDAPGPSTLECETVGGVDWLIDPADAPHYRLTTFGRTPAVEVYLDADAVSSRTVMDAIAVAAQQLPTDGRECTSRSSD
ncbi:MAG: DUF3515 family protein [Microbacterium sp.]